MILCEPVASPMATAQLHVRCKVRLPVPEAIGSGEGVSSSRSLRSSSSLCLVLKKVGATSQIRVGRVSQRRRSKGGRNRAEYRGGGGGSVTDHGYDVYELLGVEPEAPLPEIKQAYRWLQKRCHPDIAGPVGHDMAILLNDAYTILSDPMQRAAYDVKRIERAAYEGYTGEPLYSKWLGPVEEDRAIFVDETKCVGCLKCALIASNTFAIENRYGRARAVGQWGDSESTIRDAIRACPVDCISFVGREQLPALEFVMSKQPRVIVGVDAYSHGGQRSEDVFIAAVKFLKKCAEREQVKRSNLQETVAQREARMAAAENIQAHAGRWWHHFIGKDPLKDTAAWGAHSVHASRGSIIPLNWVSESGSFRRADNHQSPRASYASPEELGPLFEAAARRRQQQGNYKQSGQTGGHPGIDVLEEDYWTPIQPIAISIPISDYNNYTRKASIKSQSYADPSVFAWTTAMHMEDVISGWMKSVLAAAPVAISVVGAVFAGMTNGLDAANSSEVVAATTATGPLPAEITTGVFMQVFLAAAVWYMIGVAVCSLAAMLTVSLVMMRQKNKQD